MAHEVPLHAEAITAVVEYLRSGVSVNVVGMRSSGRSAVLHRAVELLADDGLGAVNVSGVTALRDRPLAALSVGGLDVPGTSGAAPGLAAAVSALERRVGARPSVLVVDDADDVDQITAGVVAAVRRRVPVPVLAASRPGGRRQLATRALTVELSPAARVTLPPLRYDAVHRLVHDILPGAVEPSTLARIATKSGGLPGLVAALVDTARRTGRLVRRDSLWTARGGLWDPSLAQAVEPLLSDLTEDALDALSLLSFAGTIDIAQARTVIDWDVLSGLEDVGLVHVLAGGSEPAVGVFPPLVAEYLRNEASGLYRLRAGELLAEVAPDPSLWEPATLQPDWVGAPDGIETVMGRRFAERSQRELETRRAAWVADPSATAAVPLVRAMQSVLVSAAEVDAVVSGTRPTPEDPTAEALLVVWHAIELGLRRRDLNGARTLLTHAAETMSEYEGLMRATRAHLTLIADRMPDEDELAMPGPREHWLSVEAMRATRVEALVAACRVDEALVELADFEPAYPDFQLSVRLSRAMADIFAGRLEEGIGRALTNARQSRDALEPGSYQAYAYTGALGLLMEGRLDEVDNLLASALTMPASQSLQSHFQNGVLTLAAVTASMQGRAGYAHGLAEQAEALGATRGPYPAMAPDMAVLLNRGPGSETADALWELVDERMSAGFPMMAVTVAVSAMERRPDPERGAWLASNMAHVLSTTGRLLTGYVQALGEQDADALATSIRDLRAAGLGQYVTRAGVARAQVLRQHGEFDAAARQAEEAWAEASLYATDVRGLFAPLARAADLTAREREIAVMVSEGLQTAEIATALVLSVRTVENHLLNAFRKVGVDNREALARAVETWASGSGA